MAFELINSSVISKPIGKYKSGVLEIYQPYSDLFFSPSQSNDSLHDDHVTTANLHSDNNFYFRSTFLNDTCTFVGIYFYNPIDSSILNTIIKIVENKYGGATKSHKDETGGHLSIPADINVYVWGMKEATSNLEYNLDSKSLHFTMEDEREKQRVEKVILTKVIYVRPELINKPVVIIPDSIKNKYPNYLGKSIYDIEIDTSGRIHSFKLSFGDSILESFIIPTFKDYRFRPAKNRYGDPITSRLMVPIKFDFTIDTVQIKQK